MTEQLLPARGDSITEPLLRARDITVVYKSREAKRGDVHAVTEVDLDVVPGEMLGLVGESGCGKSTLARALLGLEPSTGEIELDGETLPVKRTPDQARRLGIVFQDPYASLNPRMTVRSALAELIRVHKLRAGSEVDARVRELVRTVGLPERVLDVRPAALSGGQRQRVAIARALALEPSVLIADEPTTALDVSVQAMILDLFAKLRNELGLAIVLITHNLGVVAAVCDRVAVMYLGRIIEAAPTPELLADPRHPYTRRLLEAVPRLGAQRRAASSALPGDPPDPAAIPSGCAFHPRCAIATDRCTGERPGLVGFGAVTQDRTDKPAFGEHLAACHYAWEPRNNTERG